MKDSLIVASFANSAVIPSTSLSFTVISNVSMISDIEGPEGAQDEIVSTNRANPKISSGLFIENAPDIEMSLT
jgi:hypothetical protein